MGNYKGEDRLEKHYTPEHLGDEMIRLADKDDSKAITRKINGGENGLLDRINNVKILKEKL